MPWWCTKHECHSIDEGCPGCEREVREEAERIEGLEADSRMLDWLLEHRIFPTEPGTMKVSRRAVAIAMDPPCPHCKEPVSDEERAEEARYSEWHQDCLIDWMAQEH